MTVIRRDDLPAPERTTALDVVLVILLAPIAITCFAWYTVAWFANEVRQFVRR